jgi:serine/threonine protein kinase
MSSLSPIQTDLQSSDRYLPLSGEGSGFVHRKWKSIFEESGLCRLEDFFSVSGNALSKPGLGKRYRARLDLTRDGKILSVFLKRYSGEHLRNLLQRWFEDGERTAIALREVHVANALEKIEIATFKPLAWGSSGNWGTTQNSFLVMSQVEGDSIERWLPQQNFSSSVESWRKRLHLVEQLAAFSRRLHESGWFHRDLYLCHIFIVEGSGKFELALVDLARMFRPRWRVERWQIKDLAQLNFSAPTKYFSRTMRLRFAKVYFGVDRFSPTHKNLIRKIAQRSEKIARRELRKAIVLQ